MCPETSPVAVPVAAGVFLAGCSSPHGDEDPDYRVVLTQVVQEAEQEGIDNHARQVIESAIRGNRPVTTEDVKTAVLETVDCIAGVGFNVQTYDDDTASGGIRFMFGLDGMHDAFPKRWRMLRMTARTTTRCG